MKVLNREINSIKAPMVDVGYISKAHGIQGEVFLRLTLGDSEFVSSLDPFHFVKEKGALGASIELNLKKFKVHKDGLIIKFNEIKDRNDAEKLRSYTLQVPSENFISKEGESLYLVEILDFKVVFREDESHEFKDLGYIVGFHDNTVQDLLIVQDKATDQEVDIPFVEEFVVDIDKKEKLIRMQLPEGLVE